MLKPLRRFNSFPGRLLLNLSVAFICNLLEMLKRWNMLKCPDGVWPITYTYKWFVKFTKFGKLGTNLSLILFNFVIFWGGGRAKGQGYLFDCLFYLFASSFVWVLDSFFIRLGSRFVEVTLTLGNRSGNETMKRFFRKLGLCIHK